MRRVLFWIFAAGDRTPAYGAHELYSTITWLFGIVIGQAVAFAASVQQQGRPIVAMIGYGAIVFATLLGIGLLLNSRDGPVLANGSRALRLDRTSIYFGRWLQCFAIVFAVAFIVASWKGWLPGQTGGRYVFSQDAIVAEAHVAGGSPGFVETILTRQEDSRVLVDKFTMDRWRRWIENDSWNAPTSNQILMLRQEVPFDKNYRTFSVVIDVAPREGGDIDVVDAFAMLGRDLATDESYDPIFRLLSPEPGASTTVPLPHLNASATAQAREYIQIRLPWIGGGNRLIPVIRLANPNEGDALLLFVKVKESSDNSIKDRPAEWFNVHLRVLKE